MFCDVIGASTWLMANCLGIFHWEKSTFSGKNKTDQLIVNQRVNKKMKNQSSSFGVQINKMAESFFSNGIAVPMRSYVMPWSAPNMLLCPLVFNLQPQTLSEPVDNISARWKGAPARIYLPGLPISTVLAVAVTLANRTAASLVDTEQIRSECMKVSARRKGEKKKNCEPKSGSQGILFIHWWGLRVQLPVI